MNNLMSKMMVLLGTVLLASSCLSGYQTGSLQHPQIQKIALAKVQNNTGEVTLHGAVHQATLNALQMYSTMEVVPAEQADAILYVTVVSTDLAGVDYVYRSDDREEEDGRNYGSTIFESKVNLEYTVMVPGRNRPLIIPTKISGEARFDSTADLEATRAYGRRQAAADASRKMVHAITEAW